ncbi:MAG: glycine/betaine ABC transporter permease, partial [Arenicella sp.]
MSVKEKEFELLNPFYSVDSGIGDWANGIKAWAIEHRESMQPLRTVVNDLIVGIESVFQSTPQLVMLII